MSIVTTIVCALSVLSGDKLFQSPALDLQFTYPDVWKVQKTRVGFVFTIPVQGDPKGATVEVIEASFRDAREKWQEAQLKVNENMRRAVDRQWQEEILGVPLLLTKISYTQQGTAVTSLVGLLYSATPSKLQFRLTAPTVSYDEMEMGWRNVLLNLRTISGTMPAVEDPSKPAPPEPKKGDTKPDTKVNAPVPKPKPPIRLEPAWKSQGKRTLAPVPIECRAGGRATVLRVPNGWSGSLQEDRIVLTHPEVAGSVVVEPLSTIDSPAPERKLILSAGATISAFTAIQRREDLPPIRNRAGATVLVVRRIGSSAAGPRTEVQAVGSLGELYWLLTYQAGGGDVFQRDRKLLETLIQTMSLEPAS